MSEQKIGNEPNKRPKEHKWELLFEHGEDQPLWNHNPTKIVYRYSVLKII